MSAYQLVVWALFFKSTVLSPVKAACIGLTSGRAGERDFYCSSEQVLVQTPQCLSPIDLQEERGMERGS